MNDSYEQYTVLSEVYDRLTFDVDYKSYAAMADKLFRRMRIPGKTVLDLACGTGSLSCELSRLGYDVISCDASPEMLSVAGEKLMGLENPPMLICQDMTELELFGGIDACVCALDSINYLTELWQVKRAFRRVSEHLVPGGVFLFDVKTPAMFAELSGTCSAWEDDGLFAVWQYGYDRRSGRSEHSVDLFIEDKGRYKRHSEVHFQRAYSPEMIKEILRACGMEVAGVYSDMRLRPAKDESGRLYFAARKEG